MSTTPKNSQEKALQGSERRRSKRVQLAFQIEVSGTEMSGEKFQDLTTTQDINEHGCRFTLQRELSQGDVVTIRVINRTADAPQENAAQVFEIVWVDASVHGWSMGARRLEKDQFWPVSFPAKRP